MAVAPQTSATAEALERDGAVAAAPQNRLQRVRRGVAASAIAVLPGALVLFLSFQAGGFFPGATGQAACALTIALALRITLAQRPFAGVGRLVGAVAALLAGLLAWTLVSVAWSDAPGRALLEFNRTLLYAMAFLLAATFAHDERRIALALRLAAAAVFVVSLVGWLSWVLPEVVEGTAAVATDRLAHPLTYWNGQGLMGAFGVLAGVALACSRRERPLVQALGAAAVPLCASALFFTFSRGAFLAALVGLAAFVVLLHRRELVSGALAVAAPTVVAVKVSFDADRLAASDRLAPAAVQQGQDVALGVALCCLAAFLVRLAAARWLDRPLGAVRLAPRLRIPVRVLAVLAAGIAFVAAPIALGAPAYLERSYERFVNSGDAGRDELRTRFVNPANNGRLDHWRVAVDAWQAHPYRGTGAGTYATNWNQGRRIEFAVQDAHSLYVEILSDLGLVGMALLGGALLIVLAALVRRALRRSHERRWPAADAALAALFVAWAVHAGLDWIWELSALTAWLFALAGLALAARGASTARATESRPAAGGPARPARVALALGCLVLAVIPFQVARSQASLDDAVQAFGATPRDCPAAIDHSLASLEAVGARPEGWEIIAYCNIGAGRFDLAVTAAQNAVRRDPRNWTYAYALALVQGAAGQDPRAAARRALALNPRSALAQYAVEEYGDAKPRRWPAIARRLKLPTS